VNALAARRRHPAAIAILIMLGLFLTGAVYAVVAPKDADATTQAVSAQSVEEGQALFRANCASCHGLNAEGRATGNGDKMAGPALAGVGAAAVDFQVGTGRMPMARPGVQADKKENVYSPEEITALAAFVASLGPGPAIPAEENYNTDDLDEEAVARGGQFWRTNCTACHNFAAKGGALPNGKYAPALDGVSNKHIYEAMLTGPQQMPVFSDTVLKPEEKRDIIAYVRSLQEQPKYGGTTLGSLGPVSEGLAGWLVGIGGLVGFCVWIASHSVRSKKGAKT
jgi:ubiquinol-cytochrome c reductase cytochrome c subunit